MSDRDLNELLQFLPQQPPARYVDAVTEFTPGASVRGTITFGSGHRVFDGHLPGEPLVPGVIIAEALAQLAGMALMDPGGSPIRGYLAEMSEMRFLRLIHPDEEIILSAKLDAAFAGLARFEVEAHVGDELATRGRLTLARKDG